MTTLFISHSSKDNDWAVEVQAALKVAEFQASFLDIDPKRGLHPGVKWEQALYQNLRQARAVVVLCSEHWLASPWCVAEAMIAREQGKPLFMLVTERALECSLATTPGKEGSVSRHAPSIPEAFKEHQFIALTGLEPAAAYKRLIQGLEREGLKRRDFPLPPEPYPGLNPFTAAYAAVFCGRDHEVDGLKALLAKQLQGNAQGFVLVLGASGSGKSSVVRAGLVPAIARELPEGVPWNREALRYGPNWVVPVAFKGGEGIEGLAASLASALQQAGRPPQSCEFTQVRDGLAAEMNEACRFLRDRARELLQAMDRAAGGRVLLVLDQLEEVFGAHAAPDAGALLELTLEAANQAPSLVAVMATMRSEFFDAFQTFPGAAGRYQEFPLDPMPSSEFGNVIREPAARFGLAFDPEGLPGRLVEDTFFNDALPLLAHTLQKLYENRAEGRYLRAREYEALFPPVEIAREDGGREVYRGVAASIKATADKILRSHGYHQRAEDHSTLLDLRRAFNLLAQVGETGRYTRRTARWASMPESSRPLLRAFEAQRLLTSSLDRGAREGGKPEPTLTVTHEALFRVWDRLRAWLDADQRALALRGQIRAAAALWHESGRGLSHLWSEERIMESVREIARSGVRLDDLEDAPRLRAFLGPTNRDELEALPFCTRDGAGEYGEHWRLPLSHQARASVGDRLALLGDRRPGVGLRPDGLPDIEWCGVAPSRGRETEQVTIQLRSNPDDADSKIEKTVSGAVSAFRIARYPVTVAQFQAFLDDCYREGRWHLPDSLPFTLGEEYPPPKPRARHANRPVDNVNWYDAVVFCAWLTQRLVEGEELPDGQGIRLPTEFEWQLAATGGNSKRSYPWGEEWDLQGEPWRANTYESELGRSTAVGLYPSGKSASGICDLAGSIYEWCFNGFEEPQALAPPRSAQDRRALRGGSWRHDQAWARCASRTRADPDFRRGRNGFRVLCSSPLLVL
jgi:formylglycine-generating enzyme required for sulfatase activity